MSCVIDGCKKDSRSSKTLVCEMHYYRFRRTGQYDLRPKKPRPVRPVTECEVRGCTRASARIVGVARVCGMHAQRHERTGRYSETRPPRLLNTDKEVCAVEGCSVLQEGWNAYCKKHATRVRRHGDPLLTIPPEARAVRTGPAHPGWNNAPGYACVHQRVRAVKGSATLHKCVDCGGDAAQWSYMHNDEHELIGEKDGCVMPYSTDMTKYQPRCVPCHKKFDLAWLRGRRHG